MQVCITQAGLTHTNYPVHLLLLWTAISPWFLGKTMMLSIACRNWTCLEKFNKESISWPAQWEKKLIRITAEQSNSNQNRNKAEKSLEIQQKTHRNNHSSIQGNQNATERWTVYISQRLKYLLEVDGLSRQCNCTNSTSNKIHADWSQNAK